MPDSDAAGSIGFKFVKFDFGEGQRLTLHKGALKDEASKIGEFSAFNPPPATYVSAEKEVSGKLRCLHDLVGSSFVRFARFHALAPAAEQLTITSFVFAHS